MFGKNIWSGCRVFACLLLPLLWIALLSPGKAQAASDPLDQAYVLFEQAISDGRYMVTFETDLSYSMDQLQEQVFEAALAQNYFYTKKYTCQKQAKGDVTRYTFLWSEGSFVKVKVLKSPSAARKAALRALKKCDYSTKYYSRESYYNIFFKMMMQHPEYNYNTQAWSLTDGLYGYRRSSELTKEEQDAKMDAAEEYAARIVKKRLQPGMTALQKVRLIHDFLIKSCAYDYGVSEVDGYEDAYTAYGALVRKKAVCQGYTAAFNLLAQKAGIDSMAVCGTANGGIHTWNLVKVGKKYRHVDCTWDKTLQKGSKVCYEYFNLKESVMKGNHSWKTEDFPKGDVAYCKYLQ